MGAAAAARPAEPARGGGGGTGQAVRRRRVRPADVRGAAGRRAPLRGRAAGRRARARRPGRAVPGQHRGVRGGDLRRPPRRRRVHGRQPADQDREADLHPQRQRGVVRRVGVALGVDRRGCRGVRAERARGLRRRARRGSRVVRRLPEGTGRSRPEPGARARDLGGPGGPRLHVRHDRPPEGRDDEPGPDRLHEREHRGVPPARPRRADPQHPSVRVHLRAQPAVPHVEARRDAAARAVVHVPR